MGLKQRRGRLHEELFRELTHAMGASTLLAGMRDGIGPDELMAASKVAFRWVKHEHGVELELSQPYVEVGFGTMKRFAWELRKHIRSEDSAAIINFSAPGVSHWTVPTQVRRSVMSLRDSGGRVELNLDDYKLQGSRYLIHPEETMVLRRL